mgnify:CR=1 FL=1
MDSDEVMVLSPEEVAEFQRLLHRRLARIYRMYSAYRRDDNEVLSFPGYAYLFHNIETQVAVKWLAGELHDE